MGVIYVRPNLINGKKYVGQATDLKERQRKWKNLKQRYAGKAINNARAKYGIEAFGFEILKECDDKELNFWEKYYIKKLNTKRPYGYNMTDGGDGANGLSWSEESKRKQSERFKGKNHPNYGKHPSEETKRKIGLGNKGKKHSEEAKEKNRQAHLGKHPSEETRKKMSEKSKGRKFSEERNKKISESNKHRIYSQETKQKMREANINNSKTSKPVLQINKDTNEVIAEFPSVSEIKRKFGFKIGNICNCCNGKPNYNTAYGFIWKYKESVA